MYNIFNLSAVMMVNNIDILICLFLEYLCGFMFHIFQHRGQQRVRFLHIFYFFNMKTKADIFI